MSVLRLIKASVHLLENLPWHMTHVRVALRLGRKARERREAVTSRLKKRSYAVSASTHLIVSRLLYTPCLALPPPCPSSVCVCILGRLGLVVSTVSPPPVGGHRRGEVADAPMRSSLPSSLDAAANRGSSLAISLHTKLALLKSVCACAQRRHRQPVGFSLKR